MNKLENNAIFSNIQDSLLKFSSVIVTEPLEILDSGSQLPETTQKGDKKEDIWVESTWTLAS